MFQFPPNPTPGQSFTPVAGVTYRWNGTAWFLLAGPGAFITTTEADVRYVNIDEVPNTTNRIINGKFAIDQRNAGAAVGLNTASSPKYPVDRWKVWSAGATGGLTVQRIADTVYPGEYQLSTTVLAQQTSLEAGAFYAYQYMIEGVHVADFNLGSAQASAFTVAFEIQSTIAATLCISLANGAGNRSYVVPFTVAAGVREQKVFTIPADTGGTWERSTGIGLTVNFNFGIGSTYHTATPNAWISGGFYGVAGMTNFMATAGNTFLLRNVRLYKGSVDFGPDRRLYAEELALCQRYFCKTFEPGVVPANAPTGLFTNAIWGKGTGVTCEPMTTWLFPVTMRTTPTITLYNPASSGAAGQWSDGVNATAAARALAASAYRVLIDNTDTNAPNTSKFAICATASAEL